MKTKKMTEAQILRAIATLQQVQQTNKPTSKEWNAASIILHELFAEMQKRADIKRAEKLQAHLEFADRIKAMQQE